MISFQKNKSTLHISRNSLPKDRKNMCDFIMKLYSKKIKIKKRQGRLDLKKRPERPDLHYEVLKNLRAFIMNVYYTKNSRIS